MEKKDVKENNKATQEFLLEKKRRNSDKGNYWIFEKEIRGAWVI